MSTSKVKHLVVFLIIAATIVTIIYLIKSRPEAPTKPEQETVWTVNVVPLDYSNRSPELNVLGIVESVQNTLMTSRVNTSITSTPVLAGSAVTKGDIILTMDPVEVSVVLTERQADVTELAAQVEEENLIHRANQQNLKTEQNLLDLSEKALARQKRLAKNNVTSQERLDTAEVALQQQKLILANRQLSVSNHQNRLNQLNARLERAKAQLTLAELDMEQTQLKAPFDGWVVSLRVAAGNRVRSGDPLIELVANDSLEVKAQIPDRWIPGIQQIIAVGRNTSNDFNTNAYGDFFGQQIGLQLERLAASVTTGTGGVDAYFRPAQDNPLLLGKAVSMRVILPAVSDAYALPVSAIYGYDRIYLVDPDMRLQAARILRLGRYQDKRAAEWVIFSAKDLQPGSKVITTQLPNAVSGLKVKIREGSGNESRG
jgi:RND family efflux transporter MFP subunit